MNSWIGGSLSSLKGQLTHLITEGTEEVSDPKGDLIVAKQKIIDLETQIRCLSSDVKELNEKNNEYKIKLQSEEMLLQSVSDSYKEKLKQKDEYIESLREQMLSNALRFDNNGTFNDQRDPSLMRGEQWSSEFFDFVNQSSEQTALSMSGANEADLLRHRISELGQEVLRWRSIAENVQCNRVDYIGDSEDGSVAKLLEVQRQELELQHGNYILELQQEHNKQLNFLKRSSHQRHKSSENDDYGPYTSESSHYLDQESSQDQILQSPKTTSTSATQSHGPTLYDAACQCSIEIPISESTFTDNASFRQTQIGGHNVGDSMSQVSDISEVSIKSRLLEEHVRNLSTRIEEYGYQLTNIDDIALTTQIIDDNDPEQITNKLQHLKLKLSQRKNNIIEQNNLLTDAEIVGPETVTCADSWENSSDNSLVQEPNVDMKQRMDIEFVINDIFHLLYPIYSGNQTSGTETLGLIKERVIDTLGRIENEKLFMDSLASLFTDVVGETQTSDDAVSLCESIKKKFNEMKSLTESLLEKHSILDGIFLQYQQERAAMEGEIIELARKNAELEVKLDDMSSTISRYDDLERVCNTYEKELRELKGSCTKTDLGMDSDDILEHVKTFNEEKDECIEKLESRIISLQNFCEEKDDFINAMKKREAEIIYEYDCSIDVLSSELDSVRATVEKSYENEIDYKKQIHKMNVCIREKDDMINSLNEELTMLSHHHTDEDMAPMTKFFSTEESSQTEDVKMVDYEEIGILMVENKRLEEVIEAQANSLGQYEIRIHSLDAEVSRLTRGTEGAAQTDSSEEMTRETLHHLSQMIRDKEWEIEALKSKNDSLWSIIKESGECSDDDTVRHIDKLLNEKEALSKEVLWYQENREQLVNALNLKHKESLNYHGEIQRLVAFINTEQIKWNELSVENEQLKDDMRTILEEKAASQLPEKYLVDTAVEFRHELPSYNECMESVNSDQYKSLKDRVSNLEQENRQSCQEIRRLQKQLEHVSFELEESRLQFTELMESHDRCQSQMTHYQDELAKMCKVDVSTNQLVDTAKDIWNETQEQGVSEEVVDQACTVDISDQLRMVQLQCEDYAHQIDQLKAKEMKLLKEKQIFQEHLIRIEESYTQDATIAEDREQNLRTQLRNIEDQLSVSQDRVLQLETKIASLSDHWMAETDDLKQARDEAMRRVRETEIRLAETAASLNNLQTVLDKSQQEQAMELSFQKERLMQELRSLTAERDKWQSHCRQLQSSLEAQNAVVEAAQRLTDQMEHKDDQLAEMQANMSRKEEVIDNLKMEIRKLNTVTESKVDKVLMRNLIIGYFHTPFNKRQDALRVIGSLLQFSDKDYHQIGIDTVNKSRWFSWLRSSGSEHKDQDTQEHQSFSELFIRFLERESTPLPQLRLPTNQIAAEARQHSSLSVSDDIPYVHHTQTVLDHHKFFTSSPVVTKRIGAPSDGVVEDGGGPAKNEVVDMEGGAGGSLLLLGTLPGSQSLSSSSNHNRKTDNNRNALLSLLEQ